MVQQVHRRKNSRFTGAFTLVELVVTIAIILLTVALVTAVFRGESPAQQLNRAEMDFKAYCARVRYRACETGRDQVVKYDLETKTFTAHPGEYEKFIMPGDAGSKEAQISDRSEDEQEEELSAAEGHSKLEWKLPEAIVFSSGSGSEDSLMVGEKLEIFRFFPDGGGSGSGYFEFKCKDLCRVLRITKITGRLNAVDKEEFERENQ